MLVIISDLHLTDSTSGQTIRCGAFEAFRERLRDLAYDASWRPDPNRPKGRYKPIEELHLVLMGDILDVIRSVKWCAAPPSVRPWGDVHTSAVIDKVAEITADILRNNEDSLQIIRSISDGAITLPVALGDGEPPKDYRDRQSIKGPSVGRAIGTNYSKS